MAPVYVTADGCVSRISEPSKPGERGHIPSRARIFVEPPVRIELTTFSLRVRCSTNWAKAAGDWVSLGTA